MNHSASCEREPALAHAGLQLRAARRRSDRALVERHRARRILPAARSAARHEREDLRDRARRVARSARSRPLADRCQVEPAPIPAPVRRCRTAASTAAADACCAADSGCAGIAIVGRFAAGDGLRWRGCGGCERRTRDERRRRLRRGDRFAARDFGARRTAAQPAAASSPIGRIGRACDRRNERRVRDCRAAAEPTTCRFGADRWPRRRSRPTASRRAARTGALGPGARDSGWRVSNRSSSSLLGRDVERHRRRRRRRLLAHDRPACAIGLRDRLTLPRAGRRRASSPLRAHHPSRRASAPGLRGRGCGDPVIEVASSSTSTPSSIGVDLDRTGPLAERRTAGSGDLAERSASGRGAASSVSSASVSLSSIGTGARCAAR